MADYRSVSQYKSWKDCGYRYRLERIDKVWQRPAAWLGQGTAEHEAWEMYERSGRTMSLEAVKDVYRAAYEREINEACETTPNFAYWFASGPYKGEADIERRYKIGLDQNDGYLDWYAQHPNEVIWVAPDGTPGIEMKFDVVFGEVPVRGFIDAVIQIGDNVRVRDNKTGNMPGDDFQLAVYARSLEKLYDVEINTGDYWMGRKGGPTPIYDLSYWTAERLTEAFAEMDAGVRAGSFEPNPEPKKCMFCSVSSSCAFSM